MGLQRAAEVARRCVGATVPGLVAAVAEGDRTYEGCWGLLDAERRVPIRPDSLVRVQSLTKPVIAVVIMMLREEGALDLERPVRAWIPALGALRIKETGRVATTELTVRHLLMHTAGFGLGIGQGNTEEDYADAGLVTPTFGMRYALAETVDRMARLPLAFEPGTRWRYGLSYEVLGRLIELITGEPLDKALRRRVFNPLGMPDTGFHVPAEKLDRLGPQYWLRDNNPNRILDDPATSPLARPDVLPSGSGGLVSTVVDYLRFARMLAAGGRLDGVRLLNPTSVAMMSSNQLPDEDSLIRWDDEPDPTLGYGYGLGVAALPPVRFGWFGASGCQAWVYPDRDLVVVTATQTMFDLDPTDAYIDALLSAD